MKLSLSPWSCKPTCSLLLIHPLKPDLAADLWLSATTSSITLLTCVCYTLCVCVCAEERGRDRGRVCRHRSRMKHCSSCLVWKRQPYLMRQLFMCRDVRAHGLDHPLQSASVVNASDRHAVCHVTFYVCNRAPLWRFKPAMVPCVVFVYCVSVSWSSALSVCMWKFFIHSCVV